LKIIGCAPSGRIFLPVGVASARESPGNWWSGGFMPLLRLDRSSGTANIYRCAASLQALLQEICVIWIIFAPSNLYPLPEAKVKAPSFTPNCAF
jgi:hypothetical protein